jgi:hypothetical protein
MGIKNTRFAVDCDKMTTSERTSSQLRDGVIVYDTDLNAYYKVVNGVWVAEPTSASDTGWAQYKDTAYTSGSPLTVTQGSTVTLANNAGSTITSHLPSGVTAFYDGTTNKITPENSGDFYEVRIDFNAWTDNNNGLAVVKLDIGGSMGVILQRLVNFPRGTGSGNVRSYSTTTGIYTLDTFLANGGTLQIESITGTTTIYDINFVINRTHKAS